MNILEDFEFALELENEFNFYYKHIMEVDNHSEFQLQDEKIDNLYLIHSSEYIKDIPIAQTNSNIDSTACSTSKPKPQKRVDF